MKYWFYLKSTVYVEVKKCHVLLYDTETGTYLEFYSEDFKNVILSLLEDDNLGVICLDDDICLQKKLNNDIEKVIEAEMGYLQNIEIFPYKPIRLVPILSLMKDVEKMTNNQTDYISNDLERYLLNLNIIVNNECNLSCEGCKMYRTQFLCCSKESYSKSLPVECLNNIFEQIQYFPLKTINFIGGNIFKYKYFEKIKYLCEKYNKRINMFCHYQNMDFECYVPSTHCTLHLMVTPPFKVNIIKTLCNTYEQLYFHFIVENIHQYNQIKIISEQYMNDYKHDVRIHPFYNGDNDQFFEKYIYLKKMDIFSSIISFREILRNKKMNANNFGELYIYPNGQVRANENSEVIGDINKNRLVDIIHSEMRLNTAWRKCREDKPCADCVYQWFCPSPSNYELVMGKPNLCHIKF